MTRRDLPLGGAVIALAGELPDLASERLRPFSRQLPATLVLDVRRRSTPEPLREAHADVLGIWRRARVGTVTRVDAYVREWSRVRPALAARIDGTRGSIDIEPDVPEPLLSAALVDVLLQQLAVEAIATSGGLLLHASAVCRDGVLTLFAGDSGIGKSTAAGHCIGAGATRVCEDRTAIELAADGVRAWPTPFQSRDVPPAAPGPLRAVHLLARAAAPRLERLPTRHGAQALLACAFAPFWDQALLQNSLASAVELTRRVPVSRLHLRDHADFVPLALEGGDAAA